MSRYTKTQLKEKAKAFLEAQKNGDDRALFVLIMLSNHTGLDPVVCQARIEAMAEERA